MKKEIVFIGLGKMGKNMAERSAKKSWRVFGFNRSATKVSQKIVLLRSLKDLPKRLSRSRIFWLMIPAGKPVEEILFSKNGLINMLEKNDIVIDGGNSFFEDSMKRAKKLAKKGIAFLDVGVSGGPEGAKNGASLMIGGEKRIFQKCKLLFEDLALPKGFQYVGKSGAGHFIKMVHNGIEYGMMQAIAEGFNLMKNSFFNLDLAKIAELYNHGSVVQSRLIEWLEKAYRKHGKDLKGVSGVVAHTGEGEWTVKTAKKLRVPVKIIGEALRFRVQSKKNPSYAGKILSALREQFGGHDVKIKR